VQAALKASARLSSVVLKDKEPTNNLLFCILSPLVRGKKSRN
jgi:hypothetical protein